MVKRGRPRKRMKLSLQKAVSKTLDERIRDGVLARDAGGYCYNLLTGKEQRELGEQQCWARLKQAMERSRNSVHAASTMPLPGIPFPGLLAAYALDIEGDGERAARRTVKQTVRLSQLEFRRAMSIREAQLEADNERLAAMQRAYKAVEPIWNANPELTFGEICEIYRREKGVDAA